ncbi:MAG: hypothetical protein ACUVXJ_20120, partial [Phycisphaerae bacterium]
TLAGRVGVDVVVRRTQFADRGLKHQFIGHAAAGARGPELLSSSNASGLIRPAPAASLAKFIRERSQA